MPDNCPRPAQVLAAVLFRGVIPDLKSTASTTGPAVPQYKVVFWQTRTACKSIGVNDKIVAARLCVEVIHDSIAAALIVSIVNIISAALRVSVKIFIVREF